MAKITSKASLNVGTELTVNTATKKITLNVAGNLVAKDGCAFQALYSKMVDLWTTAAYNDFPFPFYALDVLSGQYLVGTDGATYNGWTFGDDPTRGYLRDGGWSEFNAAGVLARQYAGIVSLGSVSAGSQLYYQTTATGAPVNFLYADAVNQGVQVYGDLAADALTTTFDTRTFFKGFVREYAKKYKDSVLADTGKTSTGANLVNVLLANETDLDITSNDAGITAAPYSEINVKYFATAFNKDIDVSGTPRTFGIVVDVGTHSGVDGAGANAAMAMTTAAAGVTIANYYGGKLTIHNGPAKGIYTIAGSGGTATSIPITTGLLGIASGASFTLQRASAVSATLQQIYTKIQYQLRQSSNINGLASAGSVTGKTGSLLLNFVGSALKAGFYAPTNPNGGGTGVTVMGYSAADVNSFTSYDNPAAARDYPYSSAGSLNSNSNLTTGGTGYYRMYFTTNPAGNYGSATAVTVNDASGSPIAGVISGATINFTFDYTGNVQGGRTGGTDAAVTIVAGNASKAKPVVATGLLTASKAISISLVAETDRAYA
ncbi:MAG: hypothetical protein WCI45_05840 [Desulfuromonadales bacterium]